MMKIEAIIEKIGSGMVLKVPKPSLRERGRMPMLVEGLSTQGQAQGQARQSLLLGWEEVDEFLADRKFIYVLAKAEKEDYIHDGVVIKQGWKSKGWDGERFDYYRLMQ